MSRPRQNPPGLAGLLLWLSSIATAAGGVSCHIHPPGSTPDNPVGTIGPFESPAACETERARRFGDRARCHCAADFTPRWVPPATIPRPGDSPFS